MSLQAYQLIPLSGHYICKSSIVATCTIAMPTIIFKDYYHPPQLDCCRCILYDGGGGGGMENPVCMQWIYCSGLVGGIRVVSWFSAVLFETFHTLGIL
jgi:hypothetical protein